MSLRRLLPLLASLLLSQAVALTGVAAAELRGIKDGDILPTRSLKTPEGRELAIPGGGQGTVVVVFWSTWSPRSQPLLALWQEMAKEYSSHPLKVVTVNADHQEMDAGRVEEVRRYIADNGLTLPVAIDDRLDLYNEAGVIALPTTLFFRAGGDGAKLVHQAPGFPSSAPLDLREELERELGIAKKEEPTDHPRGRLAYQPANNALLYFGMGNALHKVGMREKARLRWAEALRRDGDYPDPLLALEKDFLPGGRTPEGEKALHDFLAAENLPALADRYLKK